MQLPNSWPGRHRFAIQYRLAICIAAGVFAGAIFASDSSHAASDSPEWAKIVAAAQQEGKVVFYTSMAPPPAARLVEGFKKAYPRIAIESAVQSSGEQLARIQQERAANVEGADVWATVDQPLPFFRGLARENALLKPVGPAMTEWPAKSLYDGAIANIGIEPRVIAYNTKLVSNPPRGWLEVLKPEYKSKIATVDVGSAAFVAFYDFIEQSTKSPDYLNRLHDLNPKLYASAIPIGQAVASGEVSIGLFAVPSILDTLKANGAPVAFTIPVPNLGTYYLAAAFAWSKHPNAALVLLDYLMSREGQTVWHGVGDSASPLPDIKGAVAAEGVVQSDPARITPEFVNAYKARFQTIFGR